MQRRSGEGQTNPRSRQRRIEWADDGRGALLQKEALERELESVLVGHGNAGQAAVVVANIVDRPFGYGAGGGSRQTAGRKERGGANNELHGGKFGLLASKSKET